MSSSATVGLDIGGTKVLGVRLDGAGAIEADRRQPSAVLGLEPLVEVCAEIVAALDPGGARRVGVGAAGLVDADGWLRYAPNLPGLRDAPLGDAIAKATGRPVKVDNDANLAALGEVTYGAARGARNAVMVTLGTGIGGGIICDGQIYRGAHGYAAEIGHITVARDSPLMCACGERGHWETIASGNALGRMARELVAAGGGGMMLALAGGNVDAVSGEEVAHAAAAGDSNARSLLAQYADNVALGLVGLANIFDPELFVVAGGLVELGPLLFDPLHAAFRNRLQGGEYRPEVAIVPAALGERAGAVGAAVLARSL